MNQSEIGKFSLGQYGSVFLDIASELDLIGSKRYNIGAIQWLDTTTSPDHLYCCSSDAKFSMGEAFGGSTVINFTSDDVDLTNDTITLSAENKLKIGDTVNVCMPEGFTITGLTAIDADGTLTSYDYHVVSSVNNKIKLSATAGGAAINLTGVTANCKNFRIASPAMVVTTEAMVRTALDIQTTDAISAWTVFDPTTDGFIDGSVMYGRWNYIKMGSGTSQAIAYLIPKNL